jgi:hypothetical protein
LRFEEIIAKFSRVASAKRLKANHIKGLKRMGGVRREYNQEYFVSLAVFDKVHWEVAAMAVKYKEAPVPAKPRFLLCFTVENLLQPG